MIIENPNIQKRYSNFIVKETTLHESNSKKLSLANSQVSFKKSIAPTIDKSSRRTFLKTAVIAAAVTAVAAMAGGSLGRLASAINNDKTIPNNEITPAQRAVFKEELQQVEQGTLQYFIDARDNETGLIFDKIPDIPDSPANDSYDLLSTPSSCIGTMAWIRAAELGMIPKEQAKDWTIKVLNTLTDLTKDEICAGFWPHFIDKKEKRSFEFATIDTSVGLVYLLGSGEYWAENGAPEIKTMAENLYKEVNYEAMRTQDVEGSDSLALSQHFSIIEVNKAKKREFSPHRITDVQDGLIATFLSLASDSIPLEKRRKMWENFTREKYFGKEEPKVYNGMTNYNDLGLFAYLLLANLIPAGDLTDSKGFNPEQAAKDQIAMQLAYCDNSGFPKGIFGISPGYRASWKCNKQQTHCKSVNPGGYYSYKTLPAKDNETYPQHVSDGTVIPPAIIAAVTLNESAAYKAWQQIKAIAPPAKYGVYHSINAFDGTLPGTQVSFELGYMLLALSKYLHGNELQQLIQKSPPIKTALQTARFL